MAIKYGSLREWEQRQRMKELIKAYTKRRDWDMVRALFMDLGEQMIEQGW